MDQFERVAVFTIIENIEHQLRGLKTLLSAGKNLKQQEAKPQRPLIQPDSVYASDQEEKDLAQQIEEMRLRNAEVLQRAAEAELNKHWQSAGSDQVDG